MAKSVRGGALLREWRAGEDTGPYVKEALPPQDPCGCRF